jgi:hypothetical protein
MKTIFDISESEKKQILNLHNVIKESLNSKLSKKTLNEQQAPPQQQRRLQYAGTDILRVAAANPTCRLAYRGEIVTMPGKPPLLRKVADYDSEKKNFVVGDILFLSDDLTFDVYKKNPTPSNSRNLTKQNQQPINWTCQVLYQKGPNPNADDIQKEIAAGWKQKKDLGNYSDAEIAKLFTKHPKYDLYKSITEPNKTGNLSPDQQAWFEAWSGQTDPVTGQVNGDLYKVNLSSAEKASGAYTEIPAPGSEKAFTDGIKVWYNPNNLSKVKGSQLSTIIANQKIDKDTCKKNIIDYEYSYDNHIEGLGPKEFDAAKRVVQACAYQHYGKWGFLGGGRKIDAIIDKMRGGSGGPTNNGERSKWRLK